MNWLNRKALFHVAMAVFIVSTATYLQYQGAPAWVVTIWCLVVGGYWGSTW